MGFSFVHNFVLIISQLRCNYEALIIVNCFISLVGPSDYVVFTYQWPFKFEYLGSHMKKCWEPSLEANLCSAQHCIHYMERSMLYNRRHRNYTLNRLNHVQARKLPLWAVLSHLFSFRLLVKVSRQYFADFCWQIVDIRQQYHSNAIYTKSLTPVPKPPD